MLHRFSYEALTRTAIYGAALSVSGCFLLYYRIQSEYVELTIYHILINSLSYMQAFFFFTHYPSLNQYHLTNFTTYNKICQTVFFLTNNNNL